MPSYDVVLWGATGFTGRLVAEYLAGHAPEGLRWAIGGRNREKLDRVRQELGAQVDVLTGDASDAKSMEALVADTRVVVSTVGPYARYGTPLVEACVARGVDYCDITGEPQWIRDNIDRLHSRAEQTGARIVHCCGFDSIPSDLGVWMLHDHLQREHGERLAAARLYVARVHGGFSGGTVASIFNLLEQASTDPRLRRTISDPYALNPDGERSGPDGRDQRGAEWDPQAGRWTAPFLMAAINTRIVRRSNALLGYPYGKEFRYSESVLTRGAVSARVATFGIGAMMLGGSMRPTRWLMRRFMPSPGQGPSAKQREEGSFRIRLLGRSAGETPRKVRGRIGADRDPGYGSTSRMLAESALCLALDEVPERGGILTPASCMGSTLLKRLCDRGVLQMEVSDEAESGVGDPGKRG